jgi:hypothetical protein
MSWVLRHAASWPTASTHETGDVERFPGLAVIRLLYGALYYAVHVWAMRIGSDGLSKGFDAVSESARHTAPQDPSFAKWPGACQRREAFFEKHEHHRPRTAIGVGVVLEPR